MVHNQPKAEVSSTKRKAYMLLLCHLLLPGMPYSESLARCLQELMDIVFDQTFPVKSEALPVSLPFEKVIFVMEDIDSASPIVHIRGRSRKSNEKRISRITAALTASTDAPCKVTTPQLFSGDFSNIKNSVD